MGIEILSRPTTNVEPQEVNLDLQRQQLEQQIQQPIGDVKSTQPEKFKDQVLESRPQMLEKELERTIQMNGNKFDPNKLDNVINVLRTMGINQLVSDMLKSGSDFNKFSQENLFIILDRGAGAMLGDYQEVKSVSDKIYEVIQEFKAEAEVQLNNPAKSTETEI